MLEALRAQNLTRRFGNHLALDRVTFGVRQGKIFGYFGLNGAGKTTTIKILTTLLRPTDGTASVLGADVETEPLRVRGIIGLVGEDGGESQPTWSPREYLGYFARLKRVADVKREVESVLDHVGLDSTWRNRPMATFSSGMKRRVELARALLGSPRVLFLDEPTRGLDLPAKRNVWSLLQRLSSRDKVTIFLSSHETNEIVALCNDMAVLRKGRLVFRGTPSDLATDASRFEQRLVELLVGPAAPGRMAPTRVA